MPLLLVDDREGRIVAEIENEDEALSVLKAMAGEQAPEHLCLVDCHATQGALVGTDRTIKVRPLS
jgi:hypothetical protein